MNKKTYEITDLEEFVKSLRSIIIENFYDGEEKRENMPEFDKLMKTKRQEIDEKLTIQEAHNIIIPMIKTVVNHLGEKEYTVSHKGFKKILNELNKRVISNILTELCSEGLIESGYDEEKNDFIFWVADKGDAK